MSAPVDPWRRHEPRSLAEEAAAWLVELEEPGADTMREFAQWLERSPRHVEEFLLATAAWKSLDGLDRERRLRLEPLLEAARDNVRRLPRDEVAPAPRTATAATTRRRVGGALAALAACLAVGVAAWLLPGGGTQAFATARGEQRAFKLEDGSVVYLNTDSRVEVRYTDGARDLRLVAGEAMFTVEHDAHRPFRVSAGDAVIQAIGTRFNVYRSAAGTTVSVVEGLVQISPLADGGGGSATAGDGLPAARAGADGPAPRAARVAAGEQARVLAGGGIVKRAVPDLAQRVSWRERRLVFRGDPLELVAREFNRYNSLQIRVAGEAARHRELTAVFDADDPQSLVSFLRRDPALRVDERAGEVLISDRPAPDETGLAAP